jgi:hypothetical protein
MDGQPEIIGDIKSKRLGWLGHVVRIEEDRMVKRIFEGHPGGRRKTVRPRKRWLNDVEEDLRLMKSETVKNQSTREDSLGEDHKGGQGPTWSVELRSK